VSVPALLILHSSGSPHGDNIPMFVVIAGLMLIGFVLVRIRR